MNVAQALCLIWQDSNYWWWLYKVRNYLWKIQAIVFLISKKYFLLNSGTVVNLWKYLAQ